MRHLPPDVTAAAAAVDYLPPGTPVDLTNCEREAIHLIGHVQPHGALLGVDRATGRVTHASESVETLLGHGAAVALGRELAELLGDEATAAIMESATAIEAAGRTYLPVEAGAGRFDVTVSGDATHALVELEPAAGRDQLSVRGFAALVQGAMARIAHGRTLADVAQAVAEQTRHLTGFDRVWVYKFHDDWHGEIIAESAHARVTEKWLGLHYPASDIPAQARALFLRHWLRLIADVEYAPSPIHAQGGAAGAPLDVGDCVLRGVSPMHVQYLRNMGVHASMSVSLVKDGRLWGLVSCHHYDGPRRVPFEVRAACELLGQAFSYSIGGVEELEQRDYVLRLGSVGARLFEHIARDGDVADGLTRHDPDVLALTSATGAAIALDGTLTLCGKTPPRDTIVALVAWLREQGRERWATDALAAAWPPAAPHGDVASGLLAIAVSRSAPDFVLWFRPQRVQTVRWGGDPRRKFDTDPGGAPRLSPRGSAALWEEEVRGRSAPWLPAEVDAARSLRGTLVDVLLARADELRTLNAELARSNAELDAFAFAAAHDLREPLRGIRSVAEIVREDYRDRALDADADRRLTTISRLTRRLEGLIDSLFHFARVGRLDLVRTDVSMAEVVADVRERLEKLLEETGVDVQVPRPLPVVRADRERATEVVYNLVSNAAKYMRPGVPGWIEIGWREEATMAGRREPMAFFVRDNGIGIAPEHHDSVFLLFRRLHARDSFGGGSGAGLTISRRIVERHGGRMWIESAQGAGSTFWFTLEPADGSEARGR
jgi:chemotaxis family two-component system sensor kinase Cph1